MEPVLEKEYSKGKVKMNGLYYDTVEKYKGYKCNCKYLREDDCYDLNTREHYIKPICKLDVHWRACEGECSKYKESLWSKIKNRIF